MWMQAPFFSQTHTCEVVKSILLEDFIHQWKELPHLCWHLLAGQAVSQGKDLFVKLWKKRKKSQSLEVKQSVYYQRIIFQAGRQWLSATCRWNVVEQKGPAYPVHVAAAQCRSPADRCLPAAGWSDELKIKLLWSKLCIILSRQHGPYCTNNQM